MKNYIKAGIAQVIKDSGIGYEFSEEEFLAAVKQDTWLMNLNDSPFVSGQPLQYEEVIATLLSKGISREKFGFYPDSDSCYVELENSRYEILHGDRRVEVGPEYGVEYGGSMTIYGGDPNAFVEFLLQFDREIMKPLKAAALQAFVEYMGATYLITSASVRPCSRPMPYRS